MYFSRNRKFATCDKMYLLKYLARTKTVSTLPDWWLTCFNSLRKVTFTDTGGEALETLNGCEEKIQNGAFDTQQHLGGRSQLSPSYHGVGDRERERATKPSSIGSVLDFRS